MTTQQEYRTQLLSAVERQLETFDLNTSVDIDVIASQMSQLARGSVHPLDEELGPFYDVAMVTKFTGWSRQNIANRISRGSLLGMSTASNSLVLPTFGFSGRSVASWVPPVVSEFRRAGVDGWTVGLWLTAPHEGLDEETPLGWLQDGGDLALVQDLVRSELSQWVV